MYKYIPCAVIVFPAALLNYFRSVLNKPPFKNHGFIDKEYIHIEDGMCYVDFYGSEDDFYYLDNQLTAASFPFNYYPKVLDEHVTFVRLINDGTDVICKSTPYAFFLAHKHIELPQRGEHSDYMIKLEHSWENQVELCLKQSVLNLLED